MGRHLATKRESKITIPEHCDPRCKIVFAEMRRQGVTYDEIEYRSGVLRSTVKAWRKNNRPSIQSLEAVLGALGWSFVAVPNNNVIAPATRDIVSANPALSRALDFVPEPEAC